MSTQQGVVISGASTGIGEATARLLARKDYIVFAGVRAEADVRRLGADHGNIRPIMLDVTEAASIEAAVQEVAASGVPLLGVVSNAGIAIGGPLEVLPTAELRRQFEVNVIGALALVQAFLPHLPEHRGRIVFVGSVAGRLPMPYVGPYSASKFALRSLSDTLRFELAPVGIKVSLLEPGSVKTPIWAKGRANRSRLAELVERGARPHYVRAVEGVLKQTEAEERNGMPVEVVSQAILHALTSGKPKTNYILGTPAKMGSIIGLLPPSLRDRALRQSTRLP
jgi:NAD(P)-dependent dehydrogenase (short-subunit alcohol dehydrogenase family)